MDRLLNQSVFMPTQALMDTLVREYGIQHHRSFSYRPQTNGAVEAANKNIKRILRKMVETSRDWSEKLPFALWAYRTSFRTSIGSTPYSLKFVPFLFYFGFSSITPRFNPFILIRVL